MYYKKRLQAIRTPSEDTLFRLGATYDEHNLDLAPSNKAKLELLETLKNMLRRDLDPEIIEHKSGIRPTSANAPIYHPTPRAQDSLCNQWARRQRVLLQPRPYLKP